MTPTDKTEELMRLAYDYAEKLSECKPYSLGHSVKEAKATLRAAILDALTPGYRLDNCEPTVWEFAPPAQSAPAQPAAEPAGITLTVEGMSPHFGTAYAHDQAGNRYLLNTGTQGIAFDSLKPGMRLVAVVNERNYVVSAEPAAPSVPGKGE